MSIQTDGRILVGGQFTTLSGHPRTNLARLINTGPATQSLAYDGSTLTWLRGGTSPEVWRTTFDFSTDRVVWTRLGEGSRAPGGWQLGNVFLPCIGTVRARGHMTGGLHNGSTWFVQSLLEIGPKPGPTILTGDGQFGFEAGQFGFNVLAPAGQTSVVEGSADLRQWTSLQTNRHEADPVCFRDSGSASFPWRFYRARVER